MGLKSLWAEFKAFAFKGNMIDLAVAVILGAAFSGVINSLVKDVIMPAISYVTTGVSEARHAAQKAAEVAAERVGVTSQPAAATEPSTQPATAPAPAAAAPPAPAPAPPADKAAETEKPVQIDLAIGRIRLGNFIAELLNFVIVAFAVFMLVVKLMGAVMKRVAGGTPAPSEPTTRECPECLSIIPIRAKRCAHCTAILPPA